jgi:hypothetical protein
MASSSNLIMVTTPTHFLIKLTSQNFPIWRRHVHSTLIGLGLDDYLTGVNSAPPKTIPGGNSVKPNPAYTTWFRQDQVIFSAVLGSCSDEIQPLIASASTAQEAWCDNRLFPNPKPTRLPDPFM